MYIDQIKDLLYPYKINSSLFTKQKNEAKNNPIKNISNRTESFVGINDAEFEIEVKIGNCWSSTKRSINNKTKS